MENTLQVNDYKFYKPWKLKNKTNSKIDSNQI